MIQTLRAIARFWAEFHYGPSVRELRLATGASSTSVVAYRLNRLRELGWITYTDGISRSYRLTQAGEDRAACLP